MADMTAPTKLPALLPCPFCGEGETIVHHNRGTWRGVHGYGPDISVEVRHWCPPFEGMSSRMLAFVGKDERVAIERWNRRATPPEQSDAEREELIGTLQGMVKEGRPILAFHEIVALKTVISILRAKP